MKNQIYLFCLLFLGSYFSFAQDVNHNAFKKNEYLKYRIHYGPINAGFATLKIQSSQYDSRPHYKMIGNGYTVGAAKLFFKVNDDYITYIDKKTLQPSKFVRKIDEGGYTKNKVLYFDIPKRKVTVHNKKYKTKKRYLTPKDVQDMLSTFYYMRTFKNTELKKGKVIKINMFMDEEIYKFQIKVLGRETIKTKFGKVKALKIRPYVQHGRVFKAQESLTLWVTDDPNHVPLRVKAELAVGSLKADLHQYKNTVHKIRFF